LKFEILVKSNAYRPVIAEQYGLFGRSFIRIELEGIDLLFDTSFILFKFRFLIHCCILYSLSDVFPQQNVCLDKSDDLLRFDKYFNLSSIIYKIK